MVATPLLDRQEPVAVNPQSGGSGTVFVAAMLVTLVVFRALESGATDFVVQVALAFIPALLAATLIHELGHLSAALAVGFRFRSFSVGPLIVRREAGVLRVQFALARLLAGGYVQAVPDSPAMLRRRTLIFTAGGPAATLGSLAFLPLLPAGPIATALRLVTLLGLVWTCWPRYIHGFVTDGLGILLLRRAGVESDRLMAILYIDALDAQGVEPRNWHADALERLRLPGETPLLGPAATLLVAHAFDCGGAEKRALAVERALAFAPITVPLLRRAAFETAAWVQGFDRRDAATAAAWLSDARAVKGVIEQKDWDADAMAAVAFAEGNYAVATEYLTRGVAFLDGQPAGGAVAACRRRLVDLRNRIETEYTCMRGTVGDQSTARC
jgi:hypothetical protein